MLRISGITIPDNKRLEIGLTSVYGIGRNRAGEILAKLKIEPGLKPKDLSPEEENSIRKEVESFRIEGDLKREVSANIKRLKDIGSHVGSRHNVGLPVRGQRTKTNARTRKGPKKTMGSGKKKVDKK
ncbi:MAG TPA: 30S ribosomal protein S13 [Candidatus Paceibacterota bacterium]|nr:small subunit ribosomal protein [Patescibacteria group bacterium]